MARKKTTDAFDLKNTSGPVLLLGVLTGGVFWLASRMFYDLRDFCNELAKDDGDEYRNKNDKWPQHKTDDR